MRLLLPMQVLAVRLLAKTGSRLGEALHLGWDCVGLGCRSIVIHPRAGGCTPKTEASEQAAIIRDGRPVRVTPQILRKAFATCQAQADTAPKTLQRLLGHAPGSRVTDRYYVQEDEASKRRAIRPLPLAETDPLQRENWQQSGNALPDASAKRIANDR